MSNMSYCRFQNTYGDAAECLDALEQQKELSGDEYNAARHWVRTEGPKGFSAAF